jgi:phosphate/sulfate permease
MNDVVDLFLGGILTLWTLMLIAGFVIAAVFLVRLRRESLANAARRRENTRLVREREAARPLEQ